jgi:hypothetical protein
MSAAAVHLYDAVRIVAEDPAGRSADLSREEFSVTPGAEQKCDPTEVGAHFSCAPLSDVREATQHETNARDTDTSHQTVVAPSFIGAALQETGESSVAAENTGHFVELDAAGPPEENTWPSHDDPGQFVIKAGLDVGESLPLRVLSLSGGSDGTEGDYPDDWTGECQICLEAMVEGDEVTDLPVCAHTFHHECASKWLASRVQQVAHSCPKIRRPVPLKCVCNRGSVRAAGNEGMLPEL